MALVFDEGERMMDCCLETEWVRKKAAAKKTDGAWGMEKLLSAIASWKPRPR